MRTIEHKGARWPVSPVWAAKHLRGRFRAMATWEHEACWDRLWAILRKSDETFGQRTAGLTLEQVQAAMRRKRTRERLLATLTPAELRELRAAEAHIIVRNRADFLLGRALGEFELEFIDHAHGQGAVHSCGCELLSVLDDSRLPLAQQGSQIKFLHAHYPKQLCPRHARLMAVLGGKGSLSDKLEHIHMVVRNDTAAQAA